MHEQGSKVVVLVLVVAENVRTCQPKTQHEVIHARNADKAFHKFSTNGGGVKIKLPKSAERCQLRNDINDLLFYEDDMQ